MNFERTFFVLNLYEMPILLQEEGGGLTVAAWKLFDSAWQFIIALQRAAEGGVGSTGVEDPTQRTPQFPGVASLALGAMPFGLDKHLASLPLLSRQEGRILYFADFIRMENLEVWATEKFSVFE